MTADVAGTTGTHGGVDTAGDVVDAGNIVTPAPRPEQEQECRGKPRPPMGPRVPFWFGRGMARCTKSRGAWYSTPEITRAIFTQVRAAVRRKTLLLLWWIDGGKMVVVIVRLPGRVASGRNGYERMKYEGVDALTQGPNLSKVAMGLLL